jgi:hypothetical protein
MERMPQLPEGVRTMLPPRAYAKLPSLEEAVRKHLYPREA